MTGKRFTAFFIDMLIYVLFGGTISILCDFIFKDNFTLLYCLLYPIVMMLILCKDCIGGQSIGKRKMHIQIIRKNEIISPAMSIFRNLSYILWPIDVFVFLLSGRRIFDKIFNINVVVEDKSIKVNYKQCILALIITYLLLVLFFWFIINLDDSLLQLLLI